MSYPSNLDYTWATAAVEDIQKEVGTDPVKVRKEEGQEDLLHFAEAVTDLNVATKVRIRNKIQTQQLSKEQGFGFYLPHPNQKLHSARYEVKRLLGLGTASSVFLCIDLQASARTYVAVKILTADATEGNVQGVLREADIMQAIAGLPDNDPLSILLNKFQINGPHGRHICLVMYPMSTDLNTFRTTAPNMALPVHTVKLVIAEMLEGLKILHEADIIHTDVKCDNVLFDGPDNNIIEFELAERPPVIEDEISLNGKKYPIMRPQPLPHQHKWDDSPFLVELYAVYLTDFSHAIWSNQKRQVPFVGSESLRAPEVILQAGYDIGDNHAHLKFFTRRGILGQSKMMEVTGERFSPDVLARSTRRDHFFDNQGKLKWIDNLVPVKLEDALKNYGTISAEEAVEAAKFITECLRMDPMERWTAERLLRHPWMYRGPPPSCAGAKWAEAT
ncbi:kinase-like domain-containing protein [Lentinula aciculospora]|uniref:non-specific serine/threonine protein kinase n=1 Tax=Lentinula aciculospora TaxID=153920 RepID=A0A9W9DII8_9AGAR|nr:kinase-like domain-containing protein [Lentinula aciculospora]